MPFFPSSFIDISTSVLSSDLTFPFQLDFLNVQLEMTLAVYESIVFFWVFFIFILVKYSKT